MLTLSYVYGTIEEIEKGKVYYFGQLWDGDGDGEELLNSGAVSPDGEYTVHFEQIDHEPDVMQTLVKVTDIF